MSVEWVAPVSAALDARDTPVGIFFRDDDAGWANPRLYPLLDCFAKQNMPVDLAMIPQAVSPALANALLARRQRTPALLGLHQHGFSHCNHERQGRKCEFGPSRGFREQYRDLLGGRQYLESLFGTGMDNIFTPPWNRCSNDTADCLLELGFRAVSLDSTAAPFNLTALAEMPVCIDWCGIRAGSDNPWGELAQAIAGRLSDAASEPVGIMLHHAVMDDLDLSHLQALLELFSGHRHSQARLMREFLQQVQEI